MNHQNKVVESYDKLAQLTQALQTLDHKIVVTIGSWDMLHIGHLRYLMQAKSRGDILVVGVDTDRAIKLYKGHLRPIVPQEERSEMLCYQSCVDYITYVDDVDKDGGWQYGLIDKIRPDVFIAVEDSYPEEQQAEISARCGELVVLPRQAEKTSTSRMIQKAVKGHVTEMMELLEKRG
ncbi:adenylyltransferase/cytidyltransferase family protein [Patescibacteria group bacterium]